MCANNHPRNIANINYILSPDDDNNFLLVVYTSNITILLIIDFIWIVSIVVNHGSEHININNKKMCKQTA